MQRPYVALRLSAALLADATMREQTAVVLPDYWDYREDDFLVLAAIGLPPAVGQVVDVRHTVGAAVAPEEVGCDGVVDMIETLQQFDPDFTLGDPVTVVTFEVQS